MILGPRATDRILAALGIHTAPGVYNGVNCPFCFWRRAGVDAAGRFHCRHCRVNLSVVGLVQKVRGGRRSAAEKWLREAIRADAEANAPVAPVEGARGGRMWDLGRTKKKRIT
jgi:hypothetical protein